MCNCDYVFSSELGDGFSKCWTKYFIWIFGRVCLDELRYTRYSFFGALRSSVKWTWTISSFLANQRICRSRVECLQVLV
jgi:hypothetical protein